MLLKHPHLINVLAGGSHDGKHDWQEANPGEETQRCHDRESLTRSANPSSARGKWVNTCSDGEKDSRVSSSVWTIPKTVPVPTPAVNFQPPTALRAKHRDRSDKMHVRHGLAPNPAPPCGAYGALHSLGKQSATLYSRFDYRMAAKDREPTSSRRSDDSAYCQQQ